MDLFHSDKNVLVVAITKDTAKTLVTKVRVMHTNLPTWLRGNITSDNKLSLEFANGSQIKAVASNAEAGRTESLSLLCVDEAALIEKIDEIEGYANIKEGFDTSKLVDRINECDNLTDLQGIANNIYTVFVSKTDMLRTIMGRIRIVTVKYFKDWRNIHSLEKLFESLRYNNYVKTCQKYLNQLKRFYIENQEIPFINICNDVLSLQTRIEQGY
ncbi:hypothetical protein LCGC14_0910950, partial [marine sediment metagenome]